MMRVCWHACVTLHLLCCRPAHSSRTSVWERDASPFTAVMVARALLAPALLVSAAYAQKVGTACNVGQGHCTAYNHSDPGSQTYCCGVLGHASIGVCCAMDQSCSIDALSNSAKCASPTCPGDMKFCPGNGMGRNGTCYNKSKSRCCTGTLGGFDTRPIGELCPQNLRCCGGYGGWSEHASCCDPFKPKFPEACYFSYGHTKCINQSKGVPPLSPLLLNEALSSPANTDDERPYRRSLSSLEVEQALY
jgi:hypothetical protein